MSRFAPIASLTLAAFAAGCRKEPSEAASQVAPAFAPRSDAELSLLEPSGGQCVWKRVGLPSKATTEVARFPGSCVGARVAWSPDLSRAVVWFDPTFRSGTTYHGPDTPGSGHPEDPAVDGPVRLFQVDLATGKVVVLPEPVVRGSLADLGFAATGVLAFSTEDLPDAKEGDAFDVGGETITLPLIADGLPALAHAVRLEGAAWTRVESKVTTTGWDYAAGAAALDSWNQLGPRTEVLSTFHSLGDAVEDEATRALLAPWTPPPSADETDGWAVLRNPLGNLFGWQVSGEFAYTTGLLVFQPQGKPPAPLPNLGFTRGDLLAIELRGPYLLVALTSVGTWPRVYDLREAKLAFASDTARAAVFWPKVKPAAK
ncbi:MAG: hypothetical protein ACOZIN_11380 [Myxococcota bacterium]